MYTILKRRGEVPDIDLDGRLVAVDYRSPLARSQGQKNVQNTLSWISSVIAMGPEASAAINLPQAARFLGDALGVPSDLIRKDIPQLDIEELVQAINPDIAQQAAQTTPTEPRQEGEPV